MLPKIYYWRYKHMAKKISLAESEIKEGIVREYFKDGISFSSLYDELTIVFGWSATHATFLAVILLNALAGNVSLDTADGDISYIVDVTMNSHISPIKGLWRLRNYQQSYAFKCKIFDWRDIPKNSIEWFMRKQDAAIGDRITQLKRNGDWIDY